MTEYRSRALSEVALIDSHGLHDVLSFCWVMVLLEPIHKSVQGILVPVLEPKTPKRPRTRSSRADAGTSGPTTVTFEFRYPGTSTIVDTKTVPLAADGSYTLIATGSEQYGISLKVANWLRCTRNVNMASGNMTAFYLWP